MEYNRFLADGFRNLGYDYFTCYAPDELHCKSVKHELKETESLNEGSMIYDEESFERYQWPNTKNFDYSCLLQDDLQLEDGMKVI